MMAKLIQGIKIQKIGYGGIGLARMSDGKRILIKGGALPGTVVDLRIVKQRKDYVEAHIQKIHTYDTSLVDGKSFCPHFFSLIGGDVTTSLPDWQNGCGGCKRQMLSYTTQLRLKQEIVVDAFQKLKTIDIAILPILASPLEKGYRNKIEFSFGKYITNSDGFNSQQGTIPKDSSSNKRELNVVSDWSVGFHRQGEFSKIIDIANCGLISDKANEVFACIKSLCLASGLPVYDQKTHQGFFRHLVIREAMHTGQLLVNISVAVDNLQSKHQKHRNQLLETIKANPFLRDAVTTFVITNNNGLGDVIRSPETETKIFWGDGYIYEKLLFHKHPENEEATPEGRSEVSFRISPFSFFQTNTSGAQQLFAKAMDMVGKVQGTVLDLYCGTGTIGICFLPSGKGDALIGIEIVEEAITDARHNASINGLEGKAMFLASPAEISFVQHPEIEKRLDDLGLVIVDPPRDGLHKHVIQKICDLKKASDFKLLYISCNPITMVRDIELLVASGWTITTVQPVDMFPQTHHIECITVLQ